MWSLNTIIMDRKAILFFHDFTKNKTHKKQHIQSAICIGAPVIPV